MATEDKYKQFGGQGIPAKVYQDIINSESPHATNESDSEEAVIQRSIYRDSAYPLWNEEVPTPIDVWYERPLYGKVGPDYNAAYVDEATLKKLSSTEDTTILTMNFVADAFEDLKMYMHEATNKNLVNSDTTTFLTMEPKRGWTSIQNRYFEYLNAMYQGFVGVFLNQGSNKNKVVSFNDFLDNFQFYLSLLQPDFPFTRTGFIMSKSAPIATTGLVIELAEANHGDDEIKFADYLADKNFIFFARAARKFGFWVDKNAPWRLIADVKSEVMQEYMSRYPEAPTEPPQPGDRPTLPNLCDPIWFGTFVNRKIYFEVNTNPGALDNTKEIRTGFIHGIEHCWNTNLSEADKYYFTPEDAWFRIKEVRNDFDIDIEALQVMGAADLRFANNETRGVVVRVHPPIMKAYEGVDTNFDGVIDLAELANAATAPTENQEDVSQWIQLVSPDREPGVGSQPYGAPTPIKLDASHSQINGDERLISSYEWELVEAPAGVNLVYDVPWTDEFGLRVGQTTHEPTTYFLPSKAGFYKFKVSLWFRGAPSTVPSATATLEVCNTPWDLLNELGTAFSTGDRESVLGPEWLFYKLEEELTDLWKEWMAASLERAAPASQDRWYDGITWDGNNFVGGNGNAFSQAWYDKGGVLKGRTPVIRLRGIVPFVPSGARVGQGSRAPDGDFFMAGQTQHRRFVSDANLNRDTFRPHAYRNGRGGDTHGWAYGPNWGLHTQRGQPRFYRCECECDPWLETMKIRRFGIIPFHPWGDGAGRSCDDMLKEWMNSAEYRNMDGPLGQLRGYPTISDDYSQIWGVGNSGNSAPGRMTKLTKCNRRYPVPDHMVKKYPWIYAWITWLAGLRDGTDTSGRVGNWDFWNRRTGLPGPVAGFASVRRLGATVERYRRIGTPLIPTADFDVEPVPQTWRGMWQRATSYTWRNSARGDGDFFEMMWALSWQLRSERPPHYDKSPGNGATNQEEYRIAKANWDLSDKIYECGDTATIGGPIYQNYWARQQTSDRVSANSFPAGQAPPQGDTSWPGLEIFSDYNIVPRRAHAEGWCFNPYDTTNVEAYKQFWAHDVIIKFGTHYHGPGVALCDDPNNLPGQWTSFRANNPLPLRTHGDIQSFIDNHYSHPEVGEIAKTTRRDGSVGTAGHWSFFRWAFETTLNVGAVTGIGTGDYILSDLIKREQDVFSSRTGFSTVNRTGRDEVINFLINHPEHNDVRLYLERLKRRCLHLLEEHEEQLAEGEVESSIGEFAQVEVGGAEDLLGAATQQGVLISFTSPVLEPSQISYLTGGGVAGSSTSPAQVSSRGWWMADGSELVKEGKIVKAKNDIQTFEQRYLDWQSRVREHDQWDADLIVWKASPKLNFDRLFSSDLAQYIPSFELDVNLLQGYIFDFYNSYVDTNPVIRKTVFNKCANGVETTIDTRHFITLKDYENLFSDSQWCKLYLDLRLLEVGREVSEKEKKALIRRIESFMQTKGVVTQEVMIKALHIINNETKGVFAEKLGLTIGAQSDTINRKFNSKTPSLNEIIFKLQGGELGDDTPSAGNFSPIWKDAVTPRLTEDEIARSREGFLDGLAAARQGYEPFEE